MFNVLIVLMFNLKFNLSKIKDGPYRIILDRYESIGPQWIALYVNVENVAYFDSFGVIFNYYWSYSKRN